MCGSLWKIPNITNIQGIDLILAILIDSRNNYLSRVHESPFSLNMLAHVSRRKGVITSLTTRCQCNSRIAPFFRCC